MTLIASVAGIRGTIGGKLNQCLTPLDIVNFATAFFTLIVQKTKVLQPLFIVGRDARFSGKTIQELVTQTLIMMGAEVIDADLCTTPTLEMAVILEQAQAGIIITASHNPKNWNALKLLNDQGEFIDPSWGQELLELIKTQNFLESSTFLGEKTEKSFIKAHIEAILALENVQTEKIKAKNFHVVIDGINSVGALAVPLLLENLGVRYTLINAEMTGDFAHNPEPLPIHLQTLAQKVKTEKADLGLAVDPDVDRLVLVDEQGNFFGEEYTLVAVADYLLSKKPKGQAVVSNLSSSKALKDLAEKWDAKYYSAAVGEVHVVKKMKAVQALIGGEGNGGIIDPALHYGRDALVGIAYILSFLAEKNVSLSVLRATYPNYYMAKEKIELNHEKISFIDIEKKLKFTLPEADFNTEDGLKLTLKNGDWIHLRSSNTEPIIRIYTESTSEHQAQELAKSMIKTIKELI